MSVSNSDIKLKDIDDRTTLSVYGYIRKCELHSIIPDIIINLCVLFYHVGDYFTICYKSAVINDANDTVTHTMSGCVSTCYGALKIPSMRPSIHVWKFKITATKKDSFVSIGITESDINNVDDCNEAFCYVKDKINYGFSNCGWKCSKNINQIYGGKYGHNDTITMILNSVDHTLRYEVNGSTRGLCYTVECNKNLHYKMGVYTHAKNTVVKLLQHSET
eukprot:167631_1